MVSRVRCIVLDSNNVLLGLNRSGEYMLPGGKIHNKEHPVDALLREVKEETGITDFTKLNYLWEAEDNKVFLFVPSLAASAPTVENDPDKEFVRLGWFPLNAIPKNLNTYASKILAQFAKGLSKAEATTEVWVDGEKVYEIPDDEIWETSPGLVQKRVNDGKKVVYREVLPDGAVVDKTPHAMPESFEMGASENAERSAQMKKIYDMIDELLIRYIPEEKKRPTAEIMNDVEFLGKTTFKMLGDEAKTHIVVNHKIVGDESLLRQCLAHEIIHHHLYQKYHNEVADHGELFHKFAEIINEKEGKDFITEYANHTEFRTNAALKDFTNREASRLLIAIENWIEHNNRDALAVIKEFCS